MSSINTIRPTTLDGIKRLATLIKRAQKVTHSNALDLVSISAGFQNFRHARNSLSCSPALALPSFAIYVTAYWRNMAAGSSGRETLTIALTSAPESLVESRYLPLHRAFARFRIEDRNHLEHSELLDTQSSARRSICAAARALQFMQGTGLVPSKGHSRAYPGGDPTNSVPGCDHYSIWYQRESKRFVFVDEPYDDGVHQDPRRAAWALKFGQTIIRPSWPGMYFPDGGSQIYLIADTKKGADVAALGTALDRMPAPIVEADWNGESAPATPRFINPSWRLNIAPAKDVATRSHVLNRNSVGYVQTLVGPRQKPNTTMPVGAHSRVGELIKSVMVISIKRKGVYSRLNSVRCELDEWAQEEHVELPNDQFLNLYYHERGMSFFKDIPAVERVRSLENLHEAKQILAANYPESRPLRSVLAKLDLAIKSMSTWKS